MPFALGASNGEGSFFDTFKEQLAKVDSADVTYEYKVSLAVEIPLIFLAVSAVSLRVFSRIGIKKKLAVDDILIIVATVRSRQHQLTGLNRANGLVLRFGENGYIMYKLRRCVRLRSGWVRRHVGLYNARDTFADYMMH
jgi:hypothetical protein